MKISFLIHNAYGIGGTIRSTVNLTRALAARHEVEIVSVHRVADEPDLPLDPRVTLVPLIDMREDAPTFEGRHELAQQPNGMFPDVGVDFGRLRYTALHDRRIADHLASTDADVVVATRPILNGYLARHGRGDYVKVGQEHLTYDTHSDQLREDQNATLTGLDAFVTVSEADAAIYRAALPDVPARILCIPNGVPTPAVEPSGGDSKVIVAAGRLVSVKRYDRLIDAFAKIAAQRPDWTLRIYGRGVQSAVLRERIDGLGLYNRAFLMGARSPIETEWAKGAVAAVSSDIESFGMTIVEAMHCGVPVVATDCPHGPREIISDGEDGVLVPLDGGVDAYADALLRVIDDRDTRLRLGAAARIKAATYDPPVIARRYEKLFNQILGGRILARLDSTPEPSLGQRLRASLRSTFPTPTPSSAPAPKSPAAGPAARRPHARCAATSGGGFTVGLPLGDLAEGPLDFVARLRKDPEGREIRVPVPSADRAVGGHLLVTVVRDAQVLAEGRWDCYVAPRGGGNGRRLVAELVEQARLLGLPPTVGEHGVAAWIPYTTADGFLALRTWLRPAHAEVEQILIGDDSATVTAVLLGDAALPEETGAAVLAASREGDAYDFEVPVRRLGEGGRFEFTVPYADALARRVAEHDLWDLRLRTAPGGGAVPVGRIGGDTADRKKTDAVPAVFADHAQRGSTRVKPFFTTANGLALSARDHAVPAG